MVESDSDDEQAQTGGGKPIKRRRRSPVDWWNELVRATRYNPELVDGPQANVDALVTAAARGAGGGGHNDLYLFKKNLGR